MAKLSFGVRAGLAADMQWDARINDLRYQQQEKKQAEIAAKAEAKQYADDLSYKNVMNSFDNAKVKAYAQNQIKMIGKFVNENHDFETNIPKRQQYQQMINDLKDNGDYRRGLQSDTARQEMLKDYAEKSKNPDLINKDAYNKIDQQWKNYERFGNQYATNEEEAKQLGTKAFVYTQPQDFKDLAEEGLKYGNRFNDFNVIHGGSPGSYHEEPKEESLNISVNDFYSRNKEQIDQESTKVGVKPFDYAKKLYKAGIKTAFSLGDESAMYGGGTGKHNGKQVEPLEGVYTKDIAQRIYTNDDKKNKRPLPSSMVNADMIKTFLGDKPVLEVKNSDGSETVNLTGRYKAEPTGFTKYMSYDNYNKGQKHAQVIVKMSLEDARKQGISTDNYIFENTISPGWEKKAKLQTEKDSKGKSIQYVSIEEMVPFDVERSTNQQLYDGKASPTKFIQAPSDSYGEQYSHYSSDGKYGWNGTQWVTLK